MREFDEATRGEREIILARLASAKTELNSALSVCRAWTSRFHADLLKAIERANIPLAEAESWLIELAKQIEGDASVASPCERMEMRVWADKLRAAHRAIEQLESPDPPDMANGLESDLEKVLDRIRQIPDSM